MTPEWILVVEFWVPGLPKPGGSKRAFYIPKLKRAIVTDACKESKDWKRTVATFAQEKYGGRPLLAGPLAVEFAFAFPRPKGHYGSGRNAARLKASAPKYPAGRPDVLKCARSSEDALTGIIWGDDAQIVNEILTKAYADKPGCYVSVCELAA